MGCIKSSLLFFFIAAWIGSSQSLLQYCTQCTEWDENNALCVYCCDTIYECCSNPEKYVEDCKLLPCPCGSEDETSATTPTTPTTSAPTTATPTTSTPTTSTPSTTPSTTATTTTATTTTATTTTATTTTATTTSGSTPTTSGSTPTTATTASTAKPTTASTTVPTTTPAEPRQCTFPKKAARILGGAPTTVCERPWMVRVVLDLPMMPLTLCNAVLISETEILTTKYCADQIKKNEKSVKLYFGDTNITAQEDEELSRKITEMKITGDIAVGTLNLPVVARDILCTRPVCLPDNSTVFTEDKNQECKIAAWGGTEKGKLPDPVINEADVKLMSSDTCKTALQILKKYGVDGVEIPPDGALCTTAPGTAGTCHGDEGGVLLCKDQGEKTQDNWILAGLALKAPCNVNLPSTFINVTQYVKNGAIPVPKE